jgi:RNA polymerase sigma factor (sigma-70 family)
LKIGFLPVYSIFVSQQKNFEKKEESREHPDCFAHPIGWKRTPDSKEGRVKESTDSLVTRLKSGSRSAADEFVDGYYQQIYWFLRRLGHSVQESEDLTQESFLQAWDRIGQLRDSEALTGWIYGIARNLSRLHWRRNGMRKGVSREGLEITEADEHDFSELENSEELVRLRKAVVGLPFKLREAVVLHYMQHLSLSDAARAVGVGKGTFKSRLNRALNKLRKMVYP